MLAEAGVTLYTNQLLASATLVSNRISQITMQDGSIFRAQEFIDTTYEGDLIAAAGVTFTWGREATTNYDESLAGIGALAGTYNYDPHDQSTGKGTKWVSYTPTLPTNGTYVVYAWWVADPNRATNTPYDILHAAGTTRVLVNQQVSSGGWFKLLTTNFNAGASSSVTIRNDNTLAGTYCIADGIRFLAIGNAVLPPPVPIIEIVASDAVAGEFRTNTARFAIVRSGDTNPAVTVNYSVSGSATPSADFLPLPGTVTLGAGAMATNLYVTPVADDLVEGDESVTITLAASANYSRTSLSNATVVIQDRPIDAWRKNNFTAGELTNPNISGDLAIPAGDGVANLMKYALGLAPKIASPYPFDPKIQNGNFTLTYPRAKSAVDVTLTFSWSTDLFTWFPGSNVLSQILVVDQETNQIITLQATNAGTTTGFVKPVVTKL